METAMNNTTLQSIGAPEAFYCLFRSLSKNDKFAAINYIFEDEEIRHYLKISNHVTLEAFSEDKSNMPLFNSIDALHEDLTEQVIDNDDELEAWLSFSQKRLEDAYNNEEVEYTLDMIKRPNPDYGKRR